MRIIWFSPVLCLTSTFSTRIPSEYSLSPLQAIQKEYTKITRHELADESQGCSLKNVAIRKDWDSLSASERTRYTEAVLCLKSKPPILSRSLVPGIHSRFDDFVATHINQTLFVHFSGKFLPFHRYFTWIYEQALREECGYDGVQPYWDWTNHPEDLSKSSLFDGGPYSMSGNGEAIPHGNYTVTIPFSNRTVTSFPGTGGGCVQTGPFANMTVHLGPTATFPRNLSNPHGFEDNPRCLVRDFRPFLTVVEFATQKLTNLILNSTDYLAFQQTVESTAGGVHGAGHRGVGGDMADLYSSPNDPVFYFHHAAIDRVWSLWQSLDPARKYQIAETDTFQNTPPSKNASLEDEIDVGVLAATRQIKSLVSTIKGPFCYMYE